MSFFSFRIPRSMLRGLLLAQAIEPVGAARRERDHVGIGGRGRGGPEVRPAHAGRQLAADLLEDGFFCASIGPETGPVGPPAGVSGSRPAM